MAGGVAFKSNFLSTVVYFIQGTHPPLNRLQLEKPKLAPGSCHSQDCCAVQTMTNLIPGKLYVVTSWCHEQNQRNSGLDQDEYFEGMCVYYYNTGRRYEVKEGEVVLFVGEEPVPGEKFVRQVFLYDDEKFYCLTLSEYYNRVLTLATKDSVKRYRQ